MNYFLIQKEILKNAENKAHGKHFKNYYYQEFNEHVYLSDGHKIVIVPKDKCMLDLEKVAVYVELHRFVKAVPKYEAKDTHYVLNTPGGKSCEIFSLETDKLVSIQIDCKYLKEFKQPTRRNEYVELRYFGSKEKNRPLHIFDAISEEHLGLILPVVTNS